MVVGTMHCATRKITACLFATIFFKLQKLNHVKFLIPALQSTRALQFLQIKYPMIFSTSRAITNQILQRALKIRQSKMNPPGSFETSLFPSRHGVT